MFKNSEEVFFDNNELIVSKTDLKGRITYANDVFLTVSGYTLSEVMGQPHNLIRHDFMPRSVFHLLWETLQDKKEIFAYVVNKTKNGGHYWVLAHVTPSLNGNGEIMGYHSSRRVPDRDLLNTQIIPLYEELNRLEAAANNRKLGMEDAVKYFTDVVESHAPDYHQFILTLDRLAA
ncbi:PAS/PAC domain-containing protein [Candidatus Terasakiella magnetica]|uniref:PAS/PAC domain-containing protein n=1 Tax=Candidatus Terasakiella magnetica TaxID=1867952 RepID=A0A1C3RJ01_9PROT|nr:PAS domain-containing protein [Candidatus Terasakiella magnetica]SCA57241.1 PAS/PAC domain-containing protein [Candidatus Terasakiella magnetica]